MTIVDVNLPVYAHNRSAPAHAQARNWWEGLSKQQRPVGLPWAVSFGFVRLVTHPQVLVDPLSPLDALARVRHWLAQPEVRVVEPGPRHIAIVEELFRSTGVAASLTTDTHLAALAIEHQAELTRTTQTSTVFPVCAGTIRSPDPSTFISRMSHRSRARRAARAGS